MPPSHTSPAVSTVFSTFHQNDDSDFDDDYWTKKGKGAILDPPVPFLVPNCNIEVLQIIFKSCVTWLKSSTVLSQLLLWKCFRVWSIFLPLFELLMQKYSLFGGFIGGVDADDYENDDEHSL